MLLVKVSARVGGRGREEGGGWRVRGKMLTICNIYPKLENLNFSTNERITHKA